MTRIMYLIFYEDHIYMYPFCPCYEERVDIVRKIKKT